jgi:hypothetical protein
MRPAAQPGEACEEAAAAVPAAWQPRVPSRACRLQPAQQHPQPCWRLCPGWALPSHPHPRPRHQPHWRQGEHGAQPPGPQVRRAALNPWVNPQAHRALSHPHPRAVAGQGAEAVPAVMRHHAAAAQGLAAEGPALALAPASAVLRSQPALQRCRRVEPSQTDWAWRHAAEAARWAETYWLKRRRPPPRHSAQHCQLCSEPRHLPCCLPDHPQH